MIQDSTVELHVPSDLCDRVRQIAAVRGTSFEQLICHVLEETVETAAPQLAVSPSPLELGQPHSRAEVQPPAEMQPDNLRSLPLPGCVAAFEGTLAAIVDFLNEREHVDVSRDRIRSWMARHSQQAWELGCYLVMRTHKKRGNAFLYVLEIRNCGLTH